MKKILLTAAILAGIQLITAAQEEKEPQYIFGKNTKWQASGFGAPIVGFTSIYDKFAVIKGGGGALLINQTFYIGGYGMGLSTEHFRDDLSEVTAIDKPRLNIGHGGFWLGYIHNSHKLMHWAISTKVGWGEISITDDYLDEDPDLRKGRDFISVVNPQIELELNITRWFKMNLGAGYNFTFGIDKAYILNNTEYDYYEATDFNYPQATVSLLFGGFGKKLCEDKN